MGVVVRHVTREPARDGVGFFESETIDVPQDSLELGVNGKGEPSWTVKVYGKDVADVEARASALREVAERHAREIRAGKGGA